MTHNQLIKFLKAKVALLEDRVRALEAVCLKGKEAKPKPKK